MKAELYPQLLDKTGASFKNDGEYNHLYHKYKVNELKGYSLEKYNEFEQNIKMLQKKMRLPLLLLMISALPFMIFVGGIAEALPDVGLKQAYQNAPVLFWLLPVFVVLTLAALLFYLYKKKKHQLAIAELIETTGSEVDRLIEENLNVPSDAEGIYFFQRFYRAGKTKPSSVFCQEFSAYSDDLNVYIYWDAAVFKIPKRDCLAAENIEARLAYHDYTGSVNYRLPEIKQYKIRKNNNGMYMTKRFGRLLFSADGVMWVLDVPPFAFETAKKIFGKENP